MDLSYLREHPHLLRTFLTHQRIRETPVDGGSICRASRLTFDSGESLFTKEWPQGTAPQGFFHAEASGLRWLAEAGTVAVPEVLVETGRICSGWPGWSRARRPRGAAERLRAVAGGLHRAGAEAFGAPWPGYHGTAPMDNTPSHGPWHVWYARRRLLAVPPMSVDRKALTDHDVARVERVVSNLDACLGRAALANPRRPLDGKPALGRRRPVLAGRPGRARRSPRDRPGLPAPVGRRSATSTASSTPIGRRGRWPMGWQDRLAGAPAVHVPAPYRAVRRGIRVGRPGYRFESCRLRGNASHDGARAADRYGRRAIDLRVSLTDRCNLRCSYCMPPEGLPWLPNARGADRRRDHPADQHRGDPARRRARSASPAASRCCGPGWSRSCRVRAALHPRPRLSLTTNGIGLDRLAAGLREAGPRPGERLARHAATRSGSSSSPTGGACADVLAGLARRGRGRAHPGQDQHGAAARASTTTRRQRCSGSRSTMATSCGSSSRCRSTRSTAGAATR